MGTTVVAMALEDDLLHTAHVGDSRAYRLTESGLVPLTTDHSWVAELRQSGQFSAAEAEQIVGKNVITRALGVNDRVEIDFRSIKVQPGEIYILCTDGLCGYADDADIFSAAKSCGKDIDRIVNTLIQLANDRGGQDNVTVIAIRIDEVLGESTLVQVEPVTISSESDEALFRENEILDNLNNRVNRTQEVVLEPAREQGRGLPLFWIFLIFVIFAAAIIYLIEYK
jgi:serine/threonine protein phosphatase PrpC